MELIQQETLRDVELHEIAETLESIEKLGAVILLVLVTLLLVKILDFVINP